jgi:HEAT repeat protein
MLFFAPDIDKLKSQGDIAGLIKALGYERDQRIRNAAVKALADIGGDKTFAILLQTFNTSEGSIREAAVWALAHIHYRKTLEMLLSSLKADKLSLQRAAATGLGYMRDSRAIEPLLTIVQRREKELYPQVLQALALIGAKLDDHQRQSMIIAPLGAILKEDRIHKRDPALVTLDQLGWEPPANFVEPSETTVKRDKKVLRQAVFDALEEMGWQPDDSHIGAAYAIMKGAWDRCVEIGPPAAEPLIAAFKDEDNNVREAAFQTLLAIGVEACDALIDGLQNEDEDVRQAVFRVLVSLGDGGVPWLEQALLGSLNTDVRRAVVQILGAMGGPATLAPLIATLKDADADVRTYAYKAILAMNELAQQSLIEALIDESQEIRWGAATALDEMGWNPDTKELEARYWIARGEWHKCIKIGTTAVPVLVKMLDHWDENVRKQVTWALMHIGPPAVDFLIPRLDSNNPDVCKCVVVALGMIKDERALKPLSLLLSSNDEPTRKAVSTAINLIQQGP